MIRLEKMQDIVGFRIIDGIISEITSNRFASAYDTRSKRCYISVLPDIPVNTIITELIKISNITVAIQIEFDNYNNGNNVEIELYNLSMEKKHFPFEMSDSPYNIALPENTYSEFIEKVRSNV